MAKRNFSDEEIRNVVRRYTRGNSKSKIAASLGCHHSVVTRILEEARSKAAHTRFVLPESVLKGLKVRYDRGVSAYEIAASIGCSVPTAIAKLRKVGTKIRKRGRPRK